MVVREKLKYEDVLGFKYGYTPIGKPSLNTYIYFIDGLLIDTGQSNARQKIISDTNQLAIDQIFITHYHEDHTGNIKVIAKQHQCKVYGSKICSELMKKPPKISFAQKLGWGNRPNYNEIISQEKEIKTDRYTFQIISIPGHAADMIALYEPEKKWLFSADLFINSYISYFLYNESIMDQIISIKKILKLDFKVMFCSHNPQLTEPKEKLKKKLSYLENTFEDVQSLYSKGYSKGQIFKSLKMKENWLVKTLSLGQLSKLNMVQSIIRDIEKKQTE